MKNHRNSAIKLKMAAMEKSVRSNQRRLQPLCHSSSVKHITARKTTQNSSVGDTLREGGVCVSDSSTVAGSASGWRVSLTVMVSNCFIISKGENIYS